MSRPAQLQRAPVTVGEYTGGVTKGSDIDRATLEAAACWFTVDRVSKQPAVTAFKRQARLHQAIWREQQALPIGSHWSGRPRQERRNGSRIALDVARSTGANLLSDRIRDAARKRLAQPQPGETLDHDRLWSDLLSSMPMCFNLFGELHGDPERLAAATATLWPDVPGVADEVVFEWSPGRSGAKYLGDRTAFDAAILLAQPGGRRSILGIETKYHEHAVTERPPNPIKRMPRYREVTETSGAFREDWEAAILGTPLQQIWRDHLLVLAMLQDPDGQWDSGKYVLVHHAQNPSFAEAAERYRAVLTDDSTFEARTVEDLLDAHVLHPPEVERAFRERYLWYRGRQAI